MTITVIIMANIKTITPIRPQLAAWAALCGMLSCFAAVNLFASATPTATLNDSIVAGMSEADGLPLRQRIDLLNKLREPQEQALVRRPADPLGWGRLAYIRLIAQGDMPDAFAALRMSDMVSPGEPEQLPQRAWMWQKLRPVETKDQQDYQDDLWRKAYDANRDETWKLALQMNMVNDVGGSLQRSDPALYEEWKDRMASMPPAAAVTPPAPTPKR
jgi:hypothetical protein